MGWSLWQAGRMKDVILYVLETVLGKNTDAQLALSSYGGYD